MRCRCEGSSRPSPLVGIEASDTGSRSENKLDNWAESAGLGEGSGWKVMHAMLGWTRLHGILSLELAGHFTEDLPDPAVIYEAELDELDAILSQRLGGL